VARKPNKELDSDSVFLPPPTTKKGARRTFSWAGFRGKTTWDWLALLLGALVTANVAIVTTYQTHVQTLQVETRRQIIEERSRQDAAVETYANQMVTLFATSDYSGEAQQDDIRTLVRARTLVAFDLPHKKRLMRFLYDAHLIQGRTPTVSLDGVNLTNVNFSNIDLREANLSGATLRNATLSNTDLSGAYLQGTDLSSATGITNEKLDQQVASLKGATMPNGQKYEDWLKSKGGGEDGQNPGP
jgi:hypothetical protein